MGKRKQDLGDVPMGGTAQQEEDSDDVRTHPPRLGKLRSEQRLTSYRTLTWSMLTLSGLTRSLPSISMA